MRGRGVGELYAEDSFHTLSTAGQAGLAVLSLVLAAVVLVLIWVSPRRGVLIVTVIVFWLFVWFSPQVYYEYYRLIIEGLPAQIVIGDPPGTEQILALVMFSGEATLSDHGKGVLFWLSMALALVRRVGRPA
ncbi:MAG: hypothetical protein AAF501_15810 [Pseudomonadota bacterium]